MKKNKKILLAIDGSEQSLTAVRYVSRVFSKQAEVVLFHVEAESPEVLRDMDMDPVTAEAEYPFRAWKVHHQQIINEFLEKARGILIDSAFSKNTVSVKTQPIKSGIARDIRNESIQDYNVIVVGRTGLGKQVSKVENTGFGKVNHLGIKCPPTSAHSERIM